MLKDVSAMVKQELGDTTKYKREKLDDRSSFNAIPIGMDHGKTYYAVVRDNITGAVKKEKSYH